MAIIKKFVDEDGSTIEAVRGIGGILITSTTKENRMEVMIEQQDIIDFIFELQSIKKQLDNE